MKTLTFKLGQFAICVLLLTILFRYVLNLCIEINSIIGTVLCSVIYFCLMYFLGWYFGKKEAVENGFHDIGFRFHFVTYIVCIGFGFGVYYLGWNTETIKSMVITVISWGVGLVIHFIFFLFEQKRTIKGYAKDEIFQ